MNRERETIGDDLTVKEVQLCGFTVVDILI